MINHPTVENVADFDSRFGNFLSLLCRLAEELVNWCPLNWVGRFFLFSALSTTWETPLCPPLINSLGALHTFSPQPCTGLLWLTSVPLVVYYNAASSLQGTSWCTFFYNWKIRGNEICFSRVTADLKHLGKFLNAEFGLNKSCCFQD